MLLKSIGHASIALGVGVVMAMGSFVAVEARAVQDQQGPQLRVADHEELGQHLTDGDGRTLYAFLHDEVEGASPFNSTCYDECAEAWPPLVTQVSPLPEESYGQGVRGDLVLTSKRDDGSLHITYSDWPLYYFAQDENPGDVLGHSLGGNWFVISPDGEVIRDGADVVDEPSETVAAQVGPQSWSGDDIFTTETFEASGEWEIVLGAWCYDGIASVTAVAFSMVGEEVGRVTVLGEGIETVVLETPPGNYFIEIGGPEMHAYQWELEVRPLVVD